MVPAVQAVASRLSDGGGRGQDERREAADDDDGLPEQEEDDERGADRERVPTGSCRGSPLAEVAPDLAGRARTRPRRPGRRSSADAPAPRGCPRPRVRAVGDITTIRSATRIASAMLCVTSTIVVAARSQSRSSSRSKRSRLSASSALNGSSSSSTSGSSARARASATRWRVPPDSSAGRLPVTPGRAATRSASSARRCDAAVGRPAGELERVGDVVGGRPPRQQAWLLEHQADARVRARDRGRRRASPCPARAPGGRRSRAGAWTCRSRSGR